MAENLNNDELESTVVDYRTLTDTDELGTEWVEVDYTYECPSENYLDGPATETVNGRYIGPKYLYLYVNKGEDTPEERGKFETVLREQEAREQTNDFLDIPGEIELVKLDATKNPLEAEVLSDYHDNYKDFDDWVETPGRKTIPSPVIPGYGFFEYEYPIHPDHLYDDKLTTYNFETGEVELYKRSSIDTLGQPQSWNDIRMERTERLQDVDAMHLAMKEHDPAVAEKIEEYKELLRNMPTALADIDLLYVDSCWPECKEIDTDYGLDTGFIRQSDDIPE